MIVLQLIGYMLFGWVVIFIAVAIHMSKACMNGYMVFEWWKENRNSGIRNLYDLLMFMWGWFIWPIRLTQFLLEIPWLYEQYELFEQCLKVESK